MMMPGAGFAASVGGTRRDWAFYRWANNSMIPQPWAKRRAGRAEVT